MVQDAHETAADPAVAFEELRAEISLMRRAIEGLTAARERIPDYTATLAAMSAALKTAREALARIEASPAVRLPPDAFAVEIMKAGTTVRAEDSRRLHEACDALSRSIGWIDGIVERGQAAAGQKRKLLQCCAASALAAIVLWSVLPGAIARSLPESWHVPEWMAARTMGLDEQQAGRRLLAVARHHSGSDD